MNEHWLDSTPVIGLDLETTSRYPTQAVPVSAALTLHHGAAWEPVEGFPLLINPGVPIPAEAQAIHGITDAQAAQGMELAQAVDAVVVQLERAAGEGTLVVGANVHYDLTVLAWCSGRLGLESLVERAPGLLVGDGMLADRWWDRYRRGPRNLGALCEHYGVRLAAAHEAQADAVAAVEVLREVMRRAALWEPEELGRLAAGEWERQRWVELRACSGSQELAELMVRWFLERAQDYEAYRRAQGAPWHVESREWPFDAYREHAQLGLEYARQWWRVHARELERESGGGPVAVAPERLGLVLAEAFEAGWKAGRG